MNRLSSAASLGAAVALSAWFPSQAQAQEADVDPTRPSEALRDLITQPNQTGAPAAGLVEVKANEDDPTRFDEARFLNVTLARLADELGRAVNSNVVVSQQVAERRVTITLRNVDLQGALNAVAISQGLVSRYDGDSGIYFLATADEVRGDLSAYISRDTEVFTLLYPNTGDVVRAIGDTFGQRVVVTQDDQFIDETFQEL
ncbi:MAG: hypothetical protein AAGA20_22990, partial [Planctomycetota bacterium]